MIHRASGQSYNSIHPASHSLPNISLLYNFERLYILDGKNLKADTLINYSVAVLAEVAESAK